MSEAVRLEVEADLQAASLPQTEPSEEDGVRFEGIAVSPGTYVAEDGLEIEIAVEHLDAIATRLEDVQIRDLHEDRVRATVGAVHDAHVANEAVAFTGEIGLQPHATIVRRFPETVAFSVGFRFARDELDIQDGRAPLPEGFGIDHLALVGQGQDPQARLTRLLNRAHPGDPTETSDETDDPTGDGHTVDEDTLDELRRQRDDALEAKEQATADLADARTRLETKDERIEELELELERTQDTVETAQQEADQARAELSRAREHFADGILKLELRAGEEINLTERREELLEMDLGDLDAMRLELAEEAAEDEAAQPATKAADTASGSTRDQELDLSELSVEDSVKLGLMKEVI